MIVSGGVNIYPQEIENLLVNHPLVMDAAVLGMPNPDFGEEVVAVIEAVKPAPAEQPIPEDTVIATVSNYCKANLAAFKCPKKIILMENLPRLPNGKLLKRIIKEQLLQHH
jgi:acyl-CoA synthetase (AMP-forming)/AMP-acid ligase II